jgi:hypothetical protein
VALADNGIAYVAYVSSIDAAELGGHIFVQRVGVAPIGLPQQVSTNQTRQVSGPSIACTAAGGSVVTWTALGADFRPNVVARRVSAAGLPVGPAPFVVSKDATFRTEPGVGVERDDGRFVIAWNVADDLGPRILAQRFSAGGAFLGSSFQVNTDKPENVNGPDVGVDDEGEFVIGWTTGRFSTVFFRAFDVTGTPEADQVKVNPLTRDFGPSDIAVDCCGDLVMAWSGVGLPAAGKAQIIATMYSVPECKDEVERPDPEVPDIVPTPPTAPALSSDLDPGVLIALANEEDARLVRFLLPEEPEERMFFPSLTVQGEPPSTFPELVAARGVGSQPPPIGEISGVVFIDLNGNGIQDPGEVGLAGQLVFLDENDNGLPDELEMQIYTDKNGVYYFGGLALSRYHVRQDLRDLRVEQTVPTQNEPRIVELTLTNFAVSGQNFGSQVEAPAGNNRSGQRPPVRSQPGPVPRTTSPSPAPGGAEPVPGNRSAPEPAPEP